MNVRLKFLGGAGTVTGSKYLIELDNINVLVDCGLFQGPGDFRKLNWDLYLEAADIDAVVLTHAHLDHSGYLPKLVKSGFSGPIYCTAATADIVKVLLLDSAKLQEEEARYALKKGYSKHNPPLPLYTIKDCERVFSLLEPVDWDVKISPFKELNFSFHYAGHILGAASAMIEVKGRNMSKKLLFSGDIGRNNDPILDDPHKFQEADIVFIESTYGNRINQSNAQEELREVISSTFNDGGMLIIPAFAVGRTQLMLYYLSQLMQENKIQKVPIYVDSPMAVEVTNIYKQHAALLKDSDISFLEYPNIHYCSSREDSQKLNQKKDFCILVSASGMCTGGRILHHLYHHLPNKKDHILFVGYQAEGTRGRAIMSGETSVTIFGENVPVVCKVDSINGLSAHADQPELLEWLSSITESPKYTFIIHGEPEASLALKEEIEHKLKWNNVIIPAHLETISLFEGI